MWCRWIELDRWLGVRMGRGGGRTPVSLAWLAAKRAKRAKRCLGYGFSAVRVDVDPRLDV